MNKLVRRQLYMKHRDWSPRWKNSIPSTFLKKLANRRVRHTAGSFNGGSYKSCFEVRLALAYMD